MIKYGFVTYEGHFLYDFATSYIV